MSVYSVRYVMRCPHNHRTEKAAHKCMMKKYFTPFMYEDRFVTANVVEESK